jgi:hypothetical protein
MFSDYPVLFSPWLRLVVKLIALGSMKVELAPAFPPHLGRVINHGNAQLN